MRNDVFEEIAKCVYASVWSSQLIEKQIDMNIVGRHRNRGIGQRSLVVLYTSYISRELVTKRSLCRSKSVKIYY